MLAEVDGASDILFGLAEMPSLPFSSPEGLSSTVVSDPLFLWVAVEAVGVAAAGLRTVDAVVLGRAGGLLSEPVTAGLVAEDVVDGRAAVDSLGVADLVAGLIAGCVVFALTVVVSSFVSMLVFGGLIGQGLARSRNEEVIDAEWPYRNRGCSFCHFGLSLLESAMPACATRFSSKR